ncbi:MAG: energy transducer TonB [Congregibacter sp.]
MTSTVIQGNDRLMLAMLIAATLHVLVIFAISFDSSRMQRPQYQVEVTLVQTPDRRPNAAQHIAQANQSGSGEQAQRESSAGQQSLIPAPPQPSAQARKTADSGKERLAAPVVSSLESNRKVVDRRGMQETLEDMPEAQRELARLNQELARLQADLDAQQEQSSQQPRVRRLTAVSARAAIDAAYLADWRRRVEAVGNQYYPEASLRYGIYGSLEMLVTIRSSGALEEIRILTSSGYAVLDEAAIRIVRRAAPFSPFPDELAQTTDKLEILRTWQFEENPLSSN